MVMSTSTSWTSDYLEERTQRESFSYYSEKKLRWFRLRMQLYNKILKGYSRNNQLTP